MPRIQQPSEVQSRLKTAVSEELITKILKGEAVLVLGHEHMLKEEFSGGNILKELTSAFFDYKHDTDKENRLSYPSFNDYYYNGAALNVMKREIAISIDKYHYSFSKDDFSPEILSLLQKKCFRMVLTTTFDYYVETIMREIWGDELRVLNIFDTGHNDIDENEYWKQDIRPTLYYVFGRAELNKNFTVVDRDAMLVIQKWLGDAAPKNFCKYMQNKCIVAMGTKFDDWLFRFFWFSLHRDIQQLSNGQVAISLQEENEADKHLIKFLQAEKIPNSRISDIVNLILSNIDQKETEYLENLGKNAEIFISYASDSYEVVKHLFYALTSRGFRVWFDKKDLNEGDEHRQIISDAINRCKIFIPVITNIVKKVLAEDISTTPTYHYFRDWEWKIANSRYATEKDNFKKDRMHIIPFCMEGIDMKDLRIHESQRDCTEFIASTSAGNNLTYANFQSFISNLKSKINN